MSASSTSGGCKNCKRTSNVPNPPSALVNLTTNPPSISMTELSLIMSNNFDGDMAGHCQNAVEQALGQFIMNSLMGANPPPNKCFAVSFTDLKITASCTCNEKDINDGKGPPGAQVAIEIGDGNIAEVPCPTPGSGGPPGIG